MILADPNDANVGTCELSGALDTVPCKFRNAASFLAGPCLCGEDGRPDEAAWSPDVVPVQALAAVELG